MFCILLLYWTENVGPHLRQASRAEWKSSNLHGGGLHVHSSFLAWCSQGLSLGGILQRLGNGYEMHGGSR